MKKMGISLLIAFAAPLLVACGSVNTEAPSEEGSNELKKITLTKAQEAVGGSVTGFGIDLFREVALEEKDNMMISPFSASLCLSMLAAGAQGETYSQMAKALGFEGLPAEDIASYYKTVVEGVLSADSSTKVSIADAIWIAKNMTLKKPYASSVAADYNAVIDKLDFTNKLAALATVNSWADRNTNGMIKKVLEDVDPYTRMMLANALYFNGKWRDAEAFSTSPRKFADLERKARETMFFRGYGIDALWGRTSDGVTVFSLPYGNGAFRMVLVLPDYEKDFMKFLAGVDAASWSKWMGSLGREKVNFEIPVFKSDFTMEDSFKKAMQKRGMELAFTPQADFGKISDESLYVNMMLQKTAIDVNEKGTEAAAVTVIGMKVTSVADPVSPRTFIADHPFIYAIVESTSNTLLFIGTHVK